PTGRRGPGRPPSAPDPRPAPPRRGPPHRTTPLTTSRTSCCDPSRPKPMRVGAIDIGSNSVRLLVADVVEDGNGGRIVRTIARAGESCRLGRGLDRSGRIEEELSEAAGGIASEFARRARLLGAESILAAGTA